MRARRKITRWSSHRLGYNQNDRTIWLSWTYVQQRRQIDHLRHKNSQGKISRQHISINHHQTKQKERIKNPLTTELNLTHLWWTIVAISWIKIIKYVRIIFITLETTAKETQKKEICSCKGNQLIRTDKVEKIEVDQKIDDFVT